MNAIEKFIHILQLEATEPLPYGPYHIFCLLAIVGLTVWLCVRFRDADEKIVNRIMLIVWIIMVTGEVYKQIVYSMDVNADVAEWSYQWYAFPYQFCSTPIYVLPFAIFFKGKVRDFAVAYMMSFSLFAGLAVMVYPVDIFIGMIGINLQTALHHGLQVVLGIYLAVHKRRELSLRHYARAIPVFAITASVALILNLVAYHSFVAIGGEIPTFNMFFISPYYECTLPLVGLIYDVVPYPVFLLVYLVGFSIAGLAIYYAVFGIYKLVLRAMQAKNNKNEEK